MRRYADTFFKYWLLAILPILVLPVGALLLLKSTPTVYGTTSIFVDENSIQQLSYVAQGVPPATNMANYLNQLLLSPTFDAGIAARSPFYRHSLAVGPDPNGAVADDLSKNATAVASGPNLVFVTYTSKNSAIAVQVVSSILKQASYETARLGQVQVVKDVALYTRQLKSARARYSAAAGDLGHYMSDHRISSSQLDLRQLSDAKLATYYQAVQSSQTDETNIQQQLSKAQTTESQNVSFRVFDAPAAKVPTTSKKKQLTSLLVPLLLGILISGAFIVARTATDPSLRYADEVQEMLGLPVLATVPYSPTVREDQRPGPGSNRRITLRLPGLKRSN
jgi:capsular polysaccharide biosynthesis protein